MAPQAYSPNRFLGDLVIILAQRGHPHYPQRAWWSALARADELDHARMLRAQYETQDVAELQISHHTLFERIYDDSLGPRMNGKVMWTY